VKSNLDATDFFRSIIFQTGIDPGKIMMIGNNPINDVIGANEAGIICAIALDWDKKLVQTKMLRVIHDPNDALFILV